MEPMALTGPQVLKVLQEPQDLKVLLGLQEPMDLKGL
jgi:hypothetical protein